jgi:TP901 family phage tail tape measure protein
VPLLPPVTQTFTINATAFLAGIDEMVAATDRLAESITVVTDQTAGLSGASEAAAAADDSMSAGATMAASAFRDQALAIQSLVGAYDEVIAGVDAVIAQDDALIASLGEVDTAAATSDGLLTGVAGKGKMAFFAVGAGIAYGVVEAAKFESTMTRLNTQAGVQKKQLGELGNGILVLASQVGQSPNSLAQALYHVESSFQSVGITGPKALALLKVAAEGSRVGGSDLVDTTNALDATIVAGIPGIHNYSQAMGALNAIVGSGDMTMQNLADAMSTGLMANAKIYGQNIAQVGAALATLGDNNIRGAKAATDLRMAWQAVLSPLKAGLPLLQSIGITSNQLGDELTHHGLTAAIGVFISHLKASKVPVSDWGQYVTDVFGKRAGPGIGILISQFDRLKGKIPDIESATKNFGSAWATTQKTLSQQWHDMISGIEALAIRFGEVLLPAVTKVIGKIAEFFGWLEKHPAFAAVAGGILAVAAAAGALGLAIGAVGTLLDPITLIAAAIIGLGVGIYEAYKHCAEFRQIVHDVAQFFKTAWADAVHVAGAVIRWFTDGPLAFIKQQLAVLEKFWAENHAEIEAVVKVVWTYIGGFIKAYMDIVVGSVKAALDILKAVWTAVWDTIRVVVKTVWDVIATIVRSTIRMVLDVIQVALDVLKGHWSDAWNHLVDLVRTALHEMITVASDILKGFITVLYNIGKDLISGLINGIKSMFGAAWGAVKSLASGIMGTIKGILKIASPSKEAEYIGLMFGAGLVAGLEGTKSQVSAAASKLATIIKDAVGAKMISYDQGLTLTSYIEKDNTRLQALATKRAAILKTITTAEKYATTTASNVESWASLSNAVAAVPTGGGISGAGLLSSLQGDLATINQFNAAIKKLARLGLNKNLLNQIIQAGPADGLQIAQALLSGPAGQINQLNSTEAQIVTASNSLGKQAANAMYDTGKYAGQGFLSGLEQQQKAIENLMKKIADAMVKRLKAELGISSPSTVAHWHGLMFAAGLAQGIDDGRGLVTSATGRLAGSMSLSRLGGASGGGAGGGGDVHVNINVQVPGWVVGPVVQKALLQLEGRNSTPQTTRVRNAA